ncbi:MAG: hypothetical protein GXO49_01630 [Chlorobi bacterium]|nr:hypothetical protein [Chlorobiota bacterium]
MKKLTFIIIASLFIFSCNSEENKEKTAKDTNSKKEEVVATENSEAYKLMKQKCIICHIEKPSPDMKGKMTAPPMMRIKEHYMPSFPSKEEFIKAVVNFSKNPTEDKVLMPGSVRKFNLMPNLGYSEEELKIIAEVIYDTDFGTMQRMKKMGSLELNNGKKWQLKPEAIEQINEISAKINNFSSDNIEDYNQLGSEIFNKAKMMMLDKDYDDATLMQIKIFFHGIENDMHLLIGEKDLEKAKSKLEELKVKFAEFNKYFE